MKSKIRIFLIHVFGFASLILFFVIGEKESEVSKRVYLSLFFITFFIIFIFWRMSPLKEGKIPKELKKTFGITCGSLIFLTLLIPTIISQFNFPQIESLLFLDLTILAIFYVIGFIILNIKSEKNEKESVIEKEPEIPKNVIQMALFYLHELSTSGYFFSILAGGLSSEDEIKASELLDSKKYASLIVLCNGDYLMGMSKENLAIFKSKIDFNYFINEYDNSDEHVKSFKEKLF